MGKVLGCRFYDRDKIRAVKFDQPEPIERGEFERILQTGDAAPIAQALIAAAFHEPDWRWVQDHALQLLNYPDLDVRRCAVIVFGHLARTRRDWIWNVCSPLSVRRSATRN